MLSHPDVIKDLYDLGLIDEKDIHPVDFIELKLKPRSQGISILIQDSINKAREKVIKDTMLQRVDEKETEMGSLGDICATPRQFKSKEVLGKEDAMKRRMARVIKRIKKKAHRQATKCVASKEG